MLLSSVDDSEAVSSVVEFEVVSKMLPLSLSEDPQGLSSRGGFKVQYIILAVNVRIIFWFTWWKKLSTLYYFQKNSLST